MQFNDLIHNFRSLTEFLRLYSSRENPIKPRDWFSYLELLVANLKPKTLGKISDLLENMIAFSKHKSLVTKSIKTLWTGYLTPKVKFEDFIRKERPTKKRRNDIAADFEALKRSCKFFEDQELIEPDLKNVMLKNIQINLQYDISLDGGHVEDRLDQLDGQGS